MKIRQKFTAFLLSLCAVFCCLSAAVPDAEAAPIWDGEASDRFAGGTGTAADPYTINTPQQLAFFAKSVNGGESYSGKHISLTDDIILNSLVSVKRWDAAAPNNKWTAVGTLSAPFSGTFDGGGHTVSGIYISTSASYQGLFGCVTGGTVKNVGVAASYISGGSYVGGIVGRLYSDKNSGGIAEISGCYNTGTVRGAGYVGGIVGLNYAYLSGSSASVIRCCNFGTVYGRSYNVGGIAGRNMANPASADSSAFVTIENCANHGSVTGSSYVGGIAGQNSASTYSASLVSACCSTGTVSGGNYSGGITGQNYASSTGTASVMNCYFLENTAVSGATSSGGGGKELIDTVSALSDADMLSPEKLTGLNFETIWTFGSPLGVRCPTLRGVSGYDPSYGDGWKNPFEDVPASAPYYDAVKSMVKSGLMNGTGDTTFSPNLGTTRGMIVTILWRISDEPSSKYEHGFTDVAPGTYYETAIAWAAEHSIVSGYGDGLFMPDRDISRQELANIIYNFAVFTGLDVSETDELTRFRDRSDVSPWAEQAVRWNVKAGIVAGTSDTMLSPQANATRAQAAIMITRFMAHAAS